MSDNVFLIGNGESRRDFDLEQLRQYGKIYGCNALYRDFTPDVLTAVDHGISHEIYNSGYSKNNECWFRSWTKVPKLMYDTMVFGDITDEEKSRVEKYHTITENKNVKDEANEFVFHGSSLKGKVGIIKRWESKPETHNVMKKEISHTGTFVSWIHKEDKSHCLTEIMPNNKDRGWACGATSGYIACNREKPKNVFLIGHDLNSTTNQINNMYKGTKYYGIPEASPIPSVNWITQWSHLFTENPLIKFHKVNKFGVKGSDNVNRRIEQWSGIQNLIYVDYPKMLDILGNL